MPNEPFLPALRSEHSRLRQELLGTALYQRLLAVEALIGMYEAAEGTAADDEREAAQQNAARTPRSGTVAAAVIEVSERYLRSIGRRAQTPEIAAEVQKAGILVGAANLIAAVSSYLSSAKDKFDNVRGEGYGLVEWLTPSAQGAKNAADGNHSSVGEVPAH
jgi:hypothetical protein